jgi:uncharacterized protein
MQFTQITSDTQNLVTAYGRDHVAVNGVRYRESLIVRPERLLPAWPVGTVEALSLEALEWIREDPPEILLVGTGVRQVFPPHPLWRQLHAQPWGLEIMDTAAACRTYNLIMSEGRAVAAALIIDSDTR